jgi:hypothetical protein
MRLLKRGAGAKRQKTSSERRIGSDERIEVLSALGFQLSVGQARGASARGQGEYSSETGRKPGAGGGLCEIVGGGRIRADSTHHRGTEAERESSLHLQPRTAGRCYAGRGATGARTGGGAAWRAESAKICRAKCCGAILHGENGPHGGSNKLGFADSAQPTGCVGPSGPWDG